MDEKLKRIATQAMDDLGITKAKSMKWILASEYAKKSGLSRSRVYQLIAERKVKSRKAIRKVERLEVLDDITLKGLADNTTKNK